MYVCDLICNIIILCYAKCFEQMVAYMWLLHGHFCAGCIDHIRDIYLLNLIDSNSKYVTMSVILSSKITHGVSGK